MRSLTRFYMGDLDDLAAAAGNVRRGTRIGIQNPALPTGVPVVQHLHSASAPVGATVVKTGFLAGFGLVGGVLVAVGSFFAIVVVVIVVSCAGLGIASHAPAITTPVGSNVTAGKTVVYRRPDGSIMTAAEAEQAKSDQVWRDKGYSVQRDAQGHRTYTYVGNAATCK